MAEHRGLFSLLPIRPEAVDLLAAEHAVYLPRSGRTNVAELRESDLESIVTAVGAVLRA